MQYNPTLSPRAHSSAESDVSRPRSETPLSSSDEEEGYQQFADEETCEGDSSSSGLTAQLEPRRSFTYFRAKVEALVRGLQDVGHLPQSINVYVLRLPGTAAYRHFRIGLDVQTSYVLRVARRSEYDIRHTTRMICWLRQNTTLPAPDLLLRHRSAANVVGRPWLITSLVPGTALSSVYRIMTIQERSSIARQFAKIITDIACAPVPAETGHTVIDDYGNLVVQTSPASPPPPTSMSLPHLSAPARGPKAFRQDRSDASALLNSSSWLRLVKKKRSIDLHDAGRALSPQTTPSVFAAFHHKVFGRREGSDDQDPVLFHPGLDPRNVYVQASGNQWAQASTGPLRRQWVITGVMSWDGCRVVPIEEAFKTPAYLTDQPCSKTILCRSGCTCVANDDLTPVAAAHIRKHFHDGLIEHRSSTSDRSTIRKSFGSRIKHVFRSKTSRISKKHSLPVLRTTRNHSVAEET
ncbi:unnamed protein product [Tilletia laevis]|uniref:Uncharacterized protein n=4 Tax=Tilletia TaxID=13289 RepID=A0A8X7MNG9_9BASI|nr:hypothetical protein CF336_g5432 [Tilletia laevis]KAE8191046.1 hypothetical protein CF328_g5799 [Tilletia controversa]KAE8253397.1 hypothetical protein A4X03_0g5906 [Tilletia caries]KAE8242258.1 hypothetical protein A4X06_0g7079 [Tilletia controversa]CAD6893446.1 unnamed protein product [Tilletia caries]